MSQSQLYLNVKVHLAGWSARGQREGGHTPGIGEWKEEEQWTGRTDEVAESISPWLVEGTVPG